MRNTFRHIMLVITTLLVNIVNCNSQIEVNLSGLPELNFSPTLSQNISQISSNSSIGYGFQIGVSLNTSKSDRLNYQTGLSYRFRTLKYNIDNIIFSSAVGGEANILFNNVELQHLVIPINVLFNLTNKDQLLIGANAEILLSENRSRKTLNKVERELLINQESTLNNTPISLNTGYIRLLTNKIKLIFNMNYGFSRIGLPLVQPDVNFQLAAQFGLKYTM